MIRVSRKYYPLLKLLHQMTTESFSISLFFLADITPATSVVEESVGNKRLNLDSMSQRLRGMEYAVRGRVVIEADRITDQLTQGDATFPFDHIVYTNIGNPHAVGQKPLTWPRQVLALADLPDDVGVNHPDVHKLFPADAIQRAKQIKLGLGGGGTGAYSHSQGAKCFRDDIAAFIQERDGGITCHAEDLFITNGASAAIEMILQALLADTTWYVPCCCCCHAVTTF